ncbi:glycoside hydrolase family protein [Flavobacterium sp. TR2]|uniref:glycoside hydrolase family protein n=1 Tax=Flavobacterium sp. TR2 TaxID=2977321 RepID=UPI0021B0BE3F|nr:glycoside hydrolase family protein [Flavobacterium sp. TR2]UWY26419.1 glycoside hydrolase family protein [Flavobacterium sp. TR2]
MKTTKKIKFSDIKGMLKRDGMREIIGGSGSSTGSGSNLYGGGGGTPALSSNPFNSSFSGSNYGGFGGSNASGGGVYGSGSITGSGESSYPGSLYYSGSTGINNLNSSTSSYNYSGTGGWVFNSDGSRTTNDPTAISRYLGFLSANNGNVTSNQMYDFLNREVSAGGREINNSNLPGIVLNEVPVVNNYKGPSTIPQGVVYDNGILHINPTNSGQGGATNGTRAVITPFTKQQVTDGLNKIKFSEMMHKVITDYDPLKKDYNYSVTFQPDMKLNSEGAYMIALYEKLSLTTYDKDGNYAKHATVGFGHKLHDGAIKSTDVKSITFDQAVTYLAQDIIAAENALNQKIENFDLTNKLTRNQYSALVDMTYNVGPGSDKNQNIVHQVLSAMQSGGVEAANKIMENSYLNKEVGGIQDRRYFEAQAFINGRLLTPEQANAELIKLGLK